MIRRKQNISNLQNTPNQSIYYDEQMEPMIFMKPFSDSILSHPYYTKLIALYFFLYYTAKWQKTNQPKATSTYISKKLKWGIRSVKKYKKMLIDMGLIENIRKINPKTKRVDGWYIKLNFIPRKTTVQKCHPVVEMHPNALSTNNKNALSTNTSLEKGLNGKKVDLFIPKPIKPKYIKPKDFDKWWVHYPRKAQKGKAKTAFNKLCTKKDKTDTPTLKDLISATKKQKKTKQWLKDNGMYIPYPSTYLNNMRWLDDIEFMDQEYSTPKTNLQSPNAYYEPDKKYREYDYIWDGVTSTPSPAKKKELEELKRLEKLKN